LKGQAYVFSIGNRWPVLHRAGRLHADALLLPVVGAGREEHGMHLGPLAVLVVQVEMHAVGVALAGVEVAPARGRSVEDDLVGSGDFSAPAEGSQHDGLGSGLVQRDELRRAL